jgi:riboflavin synthase
MFTGLIEDIGTVRAVDRRGGGLSIGVRTALPIAEIAVGASIAVDGACLTAERFDADCFYAVAGRETLSVTTLGDVRVGQAVHLERALAVGDRLGGHLVQGHVDGIAMLRSRADTAESVVLWFEAPAESARYIAAKGSVCLAGVSLTVNERDGCRFRVNVVPHTARATRFGSMRPGEAVNLEVDVLAKYVERLLSGGGSPGMSLSLETLARSGFLR